MAHSEAADASKATLEGDELPQMGDSSHPLVSALRAELLKSFGYA